MNSTDFLGLNDHKIFEVVRGCLPQTISGTLNLLAVKDGALFCWDFKDKCVLTLNIPAARSAGVSHQKLLPINNPLFSPENLIVNDSVSLLCIFGPCGVFVLELPTRYPPYGGFNHNKEVVTCRSHSLDERLFLFSETVNVLQVRFHPGGSRDNHLVVLSTENHVKFYKIEGSEALYLGVFQLGARPLGFYPSTHIGFLAALGDTAVDFDFGLPERVEAKKTNQLFSKDNYSANKFRSRGGEKIKPINLEDLMNETVEDEEDNLAWPIYVLRGDGSIFILYVSLCNLDESKIMGPLMRGTKCTEVILNYCSIICLNKFPQVLCVGDGYGTINHMIVLPVEECEGKYKRIVEEGDEFMALVEVPDKELFTFEDVQLDLGINKESEESEANGKLILIKDDSRMDRYYVVHDGGVQSVNISAVESLHSYATELAENASPESVFAERTKCEHLLCTRAPWIEKSNFIIGFSPYHLSPSIIAMLADGCVVTLQVLTRNVVSKPSIDEDEKWDPPESSLTKMSRVPFDQFLQKILSSSSKLPIFKLDKNNTTTKDCYELLQRATKIFREEYFPNHLRAKEEIEKKVLNLQMIKGHLLKELRKMSLEKQAVQERAEKLAEKYEDIKDKQDELSKRCERLLVLASQKSGEPTEVEKEFGREIAESKKRVESYQKAIEKLKYLVSYQRTKMEDWKRLEERRHPYLSELQENTIQQNLQDTSRKIAEIYQQVVDYKRQLHLR